MYQIFISYKREEKSLAETLTKILKSKGYRVWWDVDLLPGENYSRAIKEIIDSTKVTIALWSKKSLQSPFVTAEARRAFGQGKLISSLIDIEIDDLDMPFGEEQVVELGTEIRNSSGLESLIAAIVKKIPIDEEASVLVKTDTENEIYWKKRWHIALNFDSIDEFGLFLRDCADIADEVIIRAAKRRISDLKKKHKFGVLKWFIATLIPLVIASAAIVNLNRPDFDKRVDREGISKPVVIVNQIDEQTQGELNDGTNSENPKPAAFEKSRASISEENVTSETDSAIIADRREYIKSAQKYLKAKNLYDDKIDGLVGDQTHWALMRFSSLIGEGGLEYPIDWQEWAIKLESSKHNLAVKENQRNLERTGFLEKEDITGLETDSYRSGLESFFNKIQSVEWNEIKDKPPESIEVEINKYITDVMFIQSFQQRDSYSNLFNIEPPMGFDYAIELISFLKFDVLSEGKLSPFFSAEAKSEIPVKRKILKGLLVDAGDRTDELYSILKPIDDLSKDRIEAIKETLNLRYISRTYPTAVSIEVASYDAEGNRERVLYSPWFEFELNSNRFFISAKIETEKKVRTFVIQPDFYVGSFRNQCIASGGQPTYQGVCNFVERRQMQDRSPRASSCGKLLDQWLIDQPIIKPDLLNGVGSGRSPVDDFQITDWPCSFSFNLSEYSFLKN